MGTYCFPLIEDLFLYCYERNFMSDLYKAKRYDLKTYLTTPLDILVYLPSITLNWRNIFLVHIQQNFIYIKQILQKRNFFLGFIYKGHWQCQSNQRLPYR